MDRIQGVATPLVTERESPNDILWITYRWMAIGLAITGLVAFFVASSPAMVDFIVGNRLVFYGLMFAQLGLVVAFSIQAAKVSAGVAAAMFFGYAALTGLSFSVLFLVFTAASIASTFFITSATFAGLSVFGAVTKRDLSGIGRFALFALIGLIVASVVNIFMKSAGLNWVVTIAGVFIFAALTAYDTQKLKALYAQGGDSGNLALRGALTLYLDFINMFLMLLHLTGRRR